MDGVLVGDDEPVFLATLIRLVGGGVIAPFRLPAGLVEPTLVPLTVMGAGGFFSVCSAAAEPPRDGEDGLREVMSSQDC